MRYVCGFMFSASMNELLLIKKIKPAWQAGLYNGIGGKIEEGEQPVDAMCREFMEETGVVTGPNLWEHFLDIRGIGDEPYQVYCFIAKTDLIFDAKTMEDEEVTVISDPRQAIKEISTISNLQWIIPMCYDKMHHFATVLNV